MLSDRSGPDDRAPRGGSGRQWALVAESPLRQAILQMIEDEPGITLSDLMARSECGWGTLYHHLAKLTVAGLVQTQLAGRRRLAYPTRLGARSKRDASARSLLQGETAGRIAAAICKRPGRSVLQLSDDLGASPRAIYYHVRRLIQADLVRSASPTRHFGLSPTEKLRSLVADASSGRTG